MGIIDLLKRESDPSNQAVKPFAELGVAGAKISNGFVHDEFIPKLQGDRGRRIFREMRDNDATVGAIIFAIEMILRAVEWSVEENQTAPEGTDREDAAEFIRGALFDDMSLTWDEFISEVLSMLVFGWEYTEIVYKRRLGPMQKDPANRSKYNDGLIGVRKLANRAQETLDRWEIDDKGGISGLWQQPPNGGALCYIPIEKALLFRPHPSKGSPEGRSVLRGAYRSWYFLKNLQEIEAIAVERELNGLPVVYVPDAILSGTETAAQTAKNQYIQLVRDIKLNEQGGVVLPSDPWRDADGKPTGQRQVELELLSSTGSRSIDTTKTVLRYQQDIARTVLADFIMLGSSETGSFALSKNKTDFFVRALEGWLGSIAETLNRYLVPRIWTLNNFSPELIPRVAPGRPAPVDLEELGSFIESLSRSGIVLNDEETESTLRSKAGLPEAVGDGGNDTSQSTIPDETGAAAAPNEELVEDLTANE
jgi:hypothetical protein